VFLAPVAVLELTDSAEEVPYAMTPAESTSSNYFFRPMLMWPKS